MFRIRPANQDDIDQLVPLVDGYRQFYRQASDNGGARRFLIERLDQGDAHLLIALDDADTAIGFAQLFPVPSTTSLTMRWILNDLFVVPEARRSGAGSALLKAAHELAADHGVPQLMLRTQIENRTAQSRYAALGWQRDDAFYTYLLSV
ncbi:GNAT family N-acetyltransferase [Salinicola rhizosphaerae]|uniref:N-acetyltransferase YhfO n=1 Tax=Salinicola rhizosphaerae TaxID=1443141 RepID=A0ABQ3E2Z7_9GAMM|nr:GNAT family N-acetyltransferase [Salinicola rhizosphaerae]GHB21640.1 putative N-acetyltransferase YhfO [Salinicola rhizosphaerae]